MKNKIIILLSMICGLNLIHTDHLSSQSFLIPKVGVSLPTTNPTISGVEINSENGLAIGVEYQLNSGTVRFNPGIYLVRNNADLFSIDTLNSGEVQRTFVSKTNHRMIKLFLGAEAYLYKIGDNTLLNLRAGLTPTFKVGTPDYGSSDLDPDVQRGTNIELWTGLGLELGRMHIDFDYNLSLIKGFRDANMVLNAFTLTLGYGI
jgi:hypothetical protein